MNDGTSNGVVTRLVGIILILFLNGCATLSKSECFKGNWSEIGRIDGTKGRLAEERLTRHAKACRKHNVLPNRTEYLDGYRAGLISYCEPQNAYSEGFAGLEYKSVCPDDFKGEFVRQYVKGLNTKLSQLERKEYSLESDLLHDSRDYERAIAAGKSSKVINRARKQLDYTRSRIQTNRDTKYRIRNLITKWRDQID